MTKRPVRGARSLDLDSYTITENWRILVRHRMEELGIGVTKLAEMSGVTHGAISQMVTPSTATKPVKSSPHVAAIHKALKWPPPATSEDSVDEDPRLAEIRGRWDDLPETAREALVSVFRTMLPAT